MVGPCLDHVWAMFGPCLGQFETYLGHVWAMSGPCLGDAWVMFGPCLDHVRTVFGLCLDNVSVICCVISGTLLSRYWAIVGACFYHVWTRGVDLPTVVYCQTSYYWDSAVVYIYISMCSQWVSSCRVEWQCTSACVPCSVSLGQCHSAAVPVRASGRSQLPVPAAGAQHQTAAFAEASSLFKTPHVFIGRIIMVKFRCFYIDTCA
jgi:hypothetical protein